MRLIPPTIATAVLATLAAHGAGAQAAPLPQESSRAPTIWVSAAGSLFNLQSFAGGEDGASWAFGEGIQLRGTVERALRRDLAIGLAGSIAPLDVTVTDGGCNGCRGDVAFWTGMATLRLGGGGGIGFHSAFEVSAGVAGFANFDGGGAAPPTAAARDIVPALAASYGAGYTLWPGLELALVQEIGIIFYSPVQGAASSNSTPRTHATRLLLRYALPAR